MFKAPFGITTEDADGFHRDFREGLPEWVWSHRTNARDCKGIHKSRMSLKKHHFEVLVPLIASVVLAIPCLLAGGVEVSIEASRR